jgi:hypothetical protein
LGTAAGEPIGQPPAGLGTAVRSMMSSIASTLPARAGFAEMISATTPATCGPAMLVPLRLEYALSALRVAERIPTPGAEMSGFLYGSAPGYVRTGPRLEKFAIVSFVALVAPTVNEPR